MIEISVGQLFDLYLDTIGRGSSANLSLSDAEIEHNLFEEFDVGAHTYLHVRTLTKLHDAGLIDDESLAIGREARDRWLALGRRSWTVAQIKTAQEWQSLFELCDRLQLKSTSS
jgi:hypothetical protein